jgi:uncharacterized protein YndB with AHSA1/START domain
MSSQYVYVTYIRTTPQKLWDALTSPEFQKKYWFNMHQESSWKAGSPWKMVFEDGRVADKGEILESDPPRKLVIKWLNEWNPEMAAEGPARCTFTLEAEGGATRLMVVHEMERPQSQVIAAVSGGWPKILSNLKSLLETGEVALSLAR